MKLLRESRQKVYSDRIPKVGPGSSLIGRKVDIIDKDSMHYGGWGRVIYFDGDDYHVAMYEGKDDVCVFNRRDLKITKY